MAHEGGLQVGTRFWNDDQRHYSTESTSHGRDQFGHLRSNSTTSVDGHLSLLPLVLDSSSPTCRESEPQTGHKSAKGRSSRPGSAFHPYKSAVGPAPLIVSQSTAASPSKPIHFIEATFQSGHDSQSSAHSAGEGALGSCRPKRKKITPSQLSKLLEVFETTDNPGYDVRESVGKEIGMSNREVQVWFQNRRAKVTREKANALEKATSSRPRLLSNERLNPSYPASESSRPGSANLSSIQQQWRYSDSQTTQLRPASVPPAQEPHDAPKFSLSSVPRYRRTFGDQKILLPRSSSPLPSPEVSSTHSEASSYFTSALTPPLSYTATTPGTASPNWTTHGFPSDQHSRPDDQRPQFIPFGSPSSAFGQLALRSPPTHSTMGEREPFFHAIEMPSPPPPEPAEFIRLAPIRSSWDAGTTPKSSSSFTGGRRRSLSASELVPGHTGSRSHYDPASVPRTRGRLPSIRDLLNPAVDDRTPTCTPALTPSISCASTNASPVTPSSRSPYVAASSRVPTPRRPVLTTRHTTDIVSGVNRPEHRRYPSNEGGLTGLGVLAEISHVHARYPPRPSVYHP